MRSALLAVLLASVVPGPAVLAADAGDAPAAASAEAKTLKERLSSKASDEQRVDDCNVPPARRTRARPTACR